MKTVKLKDLAYLADLTYIFLLYFILSYMRLHASAYSRLHKFIYDVSTYIYVYCICFQQW